MKLSRIVLDGSVRPAIVENDDTLLDVSSFGEDWNEAFFASDGLNRLRAWLDRRLGELPRHDAKKVQYAPAIARPSKIICVGLNYADHARETGLTPAPEPVLFMKSTSAWCGPNDDLIIPRRSEKTDWEVELAVVIGKAARYVDERDALDFVAGYALHNDYSERAWQLERSGQWVKGKSSDTFAPFGPYLATRDEIEDVDSLRLWLKVNGAIRQDGNTKNFIFRVPKVVSYASQFMTLLPGDVISTGTPAGVGMGCNPQQFLSPGDVIELGITGLGTQKQVARAYSEA